MAERTTPIDADDRPAPQALISLLEALGFYDFVADDDLEAAS